MLLLIVSYLVGCAAFMAFVIPWMVERAGEVPEGEIVVHATKTWPKRTAMSLLWPVILIAGIVQSIRNQFE